MKTLRICLVLLACSVNINGVHADPVSRPEKPSPITYAQHVERLGPLENDKVRLVFLRPSGAFSYGGRSATVKVNDKVTKDLSSGKFVTLDLPLGKFKVSVDLWDVAGKCTFEANIQETGQVFFLVNARSSSAFAVGLGGAIGGAIGALAEPSVCSGAFSLGQISEEVSSPLMSELKLQLQ